MPVLDTDDYQPTRLYRNGHLATILPYFNRKESFHFSRKRITTPDQDFLDIDMAKDHNNRLIVLCHGLEGNTESLYIQGMANIFKNDGWDVMSYNYRGCGTEMNKQLRMYHSGATDDLEFVLKQEWNHYNHIGLIGFSLGGNLAMKYIGEQGKDIHPNIKFGIGISAPMDLASCSEQFKKSSRYFYNRRFIKSLSEKVKLKHQLFPDDIDLVHLKKIKTVWDFDEYYTAPIHGFDSAIDYYTKCSALRHIENAAIPTLLINSIDDPFLSIKSAPQSFAKSSQLFHLALSQHGGHVWFADRKRKNYWCETKSLWFGNAIIPSK